MNTFRLTLRNSFKNAFQSVSQLFGLIALISILSLILSLITAIYSGVINNYETLVRQSNLRTLVVDMNTDTRVKTGSDPTAAGDIPKNNVAAQQTYLYKLNQKYQVEHPGWAFSWSRTEERNFSGLNNGNYELRVKTIAKTTPNTSPNLVDALVIGEGHKINSPTQTVIDATFARKNKVRIGDILRFQADTLGTQLKVASDDNKDTNPNDLARLKQIKDLDDPNDIYNQFYSTFNWFQVVGFGESADFVSPTMDSQTPLANKNTELMAYVDPSVFGLIKNNNDHGFSYFDESRMILAVSSSADRDAYYSLRLNSDTKGYGTGLDLLKISDIFDKDLATLMTRNPNSAKLVYGVNDPEYKYYNRVWNIVIVINMYNIIAGFLLVLVLGVVLFTIGLVTKKQVEKTRSQIGLMKALGYRKRVMIFNYSVLPFITSVIGSVIGFGLAQVLQIPIINDLFGAYFNLNFPIWAFDPIGFVLVIFVTWLVISGIAALISWLIMRDSALELINGNVDPKISKAGMFIKKISFNKTVMGKLRTALLATSLGKMSAVSAVVLIATMLMTAGFAAPKVLSDNQQQSYTGIKYQQLIEYDDPIYNNPYTFMQTYDPTNLRNNFQFANGLDKITGLPIIKTGVDDQGNDLYNYDMNDIIGQLLSQKISSEYYGLEVSTSSEIPSPLNVLFSNQKMLNSRGVTLNNHFLKMIADWAQLDSFGWNILNNQWPEYIQLIDQIQEQENQYDQNPTSSNYETLLINDFYLMQNFYRSYSASVGLTVGRDYYYEMSEEANQAYLNHDYAKQIDFFNSNDDGRQKAFGSYKGERKDGNQAFGKTLAQLELNPTTKISNGKKSLLINSLYRNNDDQNPLDQYLSLNPETILKTDGLEALKSYLSDYLFWYSTYFSQRSGSALIQAAFSRPPYFVQQMFKEAYNANDRAKTYNLLFGIVPFNPLNEQLGLKLSAQLMNKNKELNFNIYGIQNNKRYLDLRDKQDNDLIQRLYQSNENNGIIINQSLAFKLGLNAGDEIDFDILYDEMQNKNQAVSLDDWKPNGSRTRNDDDYFVSKNDLDVFKTTVKDPNDSNKEYKISAGETNLTNSPSEYYQAILSGEISNTTKSKTEKFKILGVHQGYGVMQAWMKNEDVLNILNYEQAREYIWSNLFAPQFANEFSKSIYRSRDLYFPIDLRTKSYKDFMDFYVDDELNQYNVAALQINKIFNNAYPIFNYKYSLNSDIADLSTGVATFHRYGDYSPLALNGGISKGVNYDGMGASAILGLTPIRISKEILNQLSSVIQAVLILLIFVLIIITFIIIMLTTSLIITDNVRFISTMKVLGYTNRNISFVVLGMYAIVILIMFGIGYIAGWFIFAAVINQVSMMTTFVLPLVYPVWLIFAVGFGILGIYSINFGLGYRSVARNNATLVLQNQEI